MREKKKCTECNKILSKDEIALTQKMLGRNVNELYCLDCLAEYIDCDRSELEIKIEEFKEQGCTLFL
ncbi:MAG TPA: hypothetical protein PKI14_11590 [Fervidobacterium sp.]|jgi:hypothetical protein|nr:hypothetical protein [Fervidobacterium sp.]